MIFLWIWIHNSITIDGKLTSAAFNHQIERKRILKAYLNANLSIKEKDPLFLFFNLIKRNVCFSPFFEKSLCHHTFISTDWPHTEKRAIEFALIGSFREFHFLLSLFYPKSRKCGIELFGRAKLFALHSSQKIKPNT